MITAARAITEKEASKMSKSILKDSQVGVKLNKEAALFLDNEDVADKQVDFKKELTERFGSRLKTLENMFT